MTRFLTRRLAVVCLLGGPVSLAQVTVHPGDNVPKIVAGSPPGTTFVFAPGTYRLSQSIVPKDNDVFQGQTACAPPTISCPAVISGARLIGSMVVLDSATGYYKVAGQTQQNPRGKLSDCEHAWTGCRYPEDLYFDGVPYRHLDSESLPAIASGQWWFDYPNHAIYFSDNPAGHTVETSVTVSAFAGPANNVTIQYLTVEMFASMYPRSTIGQNQGGNSLTQETGWTIRNCEVTLNHYGGIQVLYREQILDNYVHNNGGSGIGGGIGHDTASETIDSGILIQGNTITYNDYAHFNPGFGSGGFKDGSTSGITLRGNTIQYNEGSGIHFDDYSLNELVDGNLITDNSDGDGLVMEIGFGNSIFRNNIILRNGLPANLTNNTYQIASRASAGVTAYCNVMGVPNARGVGGWSAGASSRGSNRYPPGQYLTSSHNSFHHNTVIWEAGAAGAVGLSQNDPSHQPDFIANNPPPDYNSYHLPDPSAANFIYDTPSSRKGRKTFAAYQAAGADIHGTVDANYTSGYPEVSITSPADQSSVSDPVTIAATAFDSSGIAKVEFYIDWSLQATVTTAPYNFHWTNGAAGAHTVAAMAYGNAGIRACYAVTLNRQ